MGGLVALLGGAISYFGWWWGILPGAFLVALLKRQSAGLAFASGTAGGILLWSGYAMLMNAPNQGHLATQVGQLIGNLSSAQMIQITGLLGGFLGGLGAWVATAAMDVIRPRMAAA